MTRPDEDLLNFSSLPSSGGQKEGDNVPLDDLADQEDAFSDANGPNIASLSDEPLTIKITDGVVETRGDAEELLNLPPDTDIAGFFERHPVYSNQPIPAFEPKSIETDPSLLATTQELSAEGTEEWDQPRTDVFDANGFLEGSKPISAEELANHLPNDVFEVPRTGSFIAEQSAEAAENSVEQFNIPQTQEYATDGAILELTADQKIALLSNFADNERGTLITWKELEGEIVMGIVKRPSAIDSSKKISYLLLQTNAETLILGDKYGSKLGEERVEDAFNRIESAEEFLRQSRAIEQLEEFHLELQTIGGQYSYPKILEGGLLCVVEFNGNSTEEQNLLQKLEAMRLKKGEDVNEYIKQRLPFSNMLYMLQAMKGMYGLVLKKADGTLELFGGAQANQIDVEDLAVFRKAILMQSHEDETGIRLFEDLSKNPEKRSELLTSVGKSSANE